MEDGGRAPRGAVQGVFLARHAYDDGLSRSQVRTKLRSGRWRRLVGDALVVADLVVRPRHLALGAVLTWPDATVALGSAAAVHGLPVADDGSVHVVVPSPRAARGRLAPHQFPVAGDEVQALGPGSMTTRLRTVIDCLGRTSDDESRRLLAWVGSRDLLTAVALADWLEGHPRAWGNSRRREALELLRSGALSEAELELHRILRRAGIAGWVANASLHASLGVMARVDVYFPAVRLVVEVDGRAAHGADRFQSDRERQNALVAAGCTVLRYTWHDLTTRPSAVASEIRRVHATIHKSHNLS